MFTCMQLFVSHNKQKLWQSIDTFFCQLLSILTQKEREAMEDKLTHYGAVY